MSELEPIIAPKCRRHLVSGRRHPDCNACRTRKRTYEANRLWHIARGTWKYLVDAGPVREHLEMLTLAGRNQRELARASGVGYGTIHSIAAGRVSRVWPIVAETLLAMQPPERPVPKKGMVHAHGTRRRTRGLIAQGWTLAHLAEIRGCSDTAVGYWLDDQRLHVSAGSAEWIRTIAGSLGRYDVDRMADPLPGMSRLAARRAAGKGYVKLSAWQGVDIDDPNAVPLGEYDRPIHLIRTAV